MGKNINEIKFSVIIPAYNAADTLERAVEIGNKPNICELYL